MTAFVDGIVKHSNINASGKMGFQLEGVGNEVILQIPASHPQVEFVKAGERIRCYLMQNKADVLLIKPNPSPSYRGEELV